MTPATWAGAWLLGLGAIWLAGRAWRRANRPRDLFMSVHWRGRADLHYPKDGDLP